MHVLSQMGTIDLSFAMNELRSVLTYHLGTFVDEVQKINKGLRYIKANRDQSDHDDQLRGEICHRFWLDLLTFGRLKPLQKVILKNTQYVLVGLCFSQNPVRVFKSAKSWLRSDKPGLPPLVAILFLDGEGVLAVLERNRIVIQQHDQEGDDSDTPGSCSRILAGLRTEEDALDLGEFLESLYVAAEPLPSWFRNKLRWNLRVLLKTWAKEADEKEGLHETVVPLFATLLDSSDFTLKEMVFNLLQGEETFRDEDRNLKPFASSALESEPPKAREALLA